jgi:hypothetical protein
MIAYLVIESLEIEITLRQSFNVPVLAMMGSCDESSDGGISSRLYFDEPR